MDKDQNWQTAWWADPGCIEQTVDREVAETATEYMSVSRRPGKWLDPWMTGACEEA